MIGPWSGILLWNIEVYVYMIYMPIFDMDFMQVLLYPFKKDFGEVYYSHFNKASRILHENILP